MRASEMERGTRIELATNSVEGCDSTIELPPPFLTIVVKPIGQGQTFLADLVRKLIQKQYAKLRKLAHSGRLNRLSVNRVPLAVRTGG